MQVTREQISSLLSQRNNLGMRAVGRALVVLRNNQTLDEQKGLTTKYLNSKGFSASDAHNGTLDANYFISNGFLSTDRWSYWVKPVGVRGRPRIQKYIGQLLVAAKEKQTLKEAQAERAFAEKINKDAEYFLGNQY